MTQDEILNEMRDIYGMSTTDYTDEYLIKLIDKARKKISEFYPENELTYFTTVKDQTRYTISQDTMIKIKEVFYNSTSSENAYFNDTDIVNNPRHVTSTFNLSKGFESVARLKALRELYPKDGEIISHNKVNLLPTPSKTGDRVYYEYERYRTLDEIPDCFLEDFLSLAMFYIKDKTYKQKNILQSGNVYNFDRRGNIHESGGSETSTDKTHMQTYQMVIDSIKSKVMKI